MPELSQSQKLGQQAQEKALSGITDTVAKKLITPLDKIVTDTQQLETMRKLAPQATDIYSFLRATSNENLPEEPSAEEIKSYAEELIASRSIGGQALDGAVGKELSPYIPTSAQREELAGIFGNAVQSSTGDIGLFGGASLMNGLIAAVVGFFQYMTGQGHEDGLFATIKQVGFERTAADTQRALASGLNRLAAKPGYEKILTTDTAINMLQQVPVGMAEQMGGNIKVDDPRSESEKATLEDVLAERKTRPVPEMPKPKVKVVSAEEIAGDTPEEKIDNLFASMVAGVNADLEKLNLPLEASQKKQIATAGEIFRQSAAEEAQKINAGTSSEQFSNAAIISTLKKLSAHEDYKGMFPANFNADDHSNWKDALKAGIPDQGKRNQIENFVLNPLQASITANFSSIKEARSIEVSPEEQLANVEAAALERQQMAGEQKQAIKTEAIAKMKANISATMEKEIVAGYDASYMAWGWDKVTGSNLNDQEKIDVAVGKKKAPNSKQREIISEAVSTAIFSVVEDQPALFTDEDKKQQAADAVRKAVTAALEERASEVNAFGSQGYKIVTPDGRVFSGKSDIPKFAQGAADAIMSDTKTDGQTAYSQLQDAAKAYQAVEAPKAVAATPEANTGASLKDIRNGLGDIVASMSDDHHLPGETPSQGTPHSAPIGREVDTANLRA